MTQKIVQVLPGLILCAVLAWTAVLTAELRWVKETLHFSPLLIVVLFGIVVASSVKLPQAFEEGLTFAQKPVLRWAVAGLGFKLSLAEMAKIGGAAVLVVVLATTAALAFGWWLGKVWGLNEKLAILLSTGGAICGASAIVAADTVVQAEGEDAAVSIGVITLWGTVAIFLFPALAQALGLHHFFYSVLAGASLQETSQVVAATQGMSPEVQAIATVVKLTRICMLAPIVFYLSWWFKRYRGSTTDAKVSVVPWFLVMFVIFAAITSFKRQLGLQDDILKLIGNVDVVLMSVGMAGVGLNTGFRDLKKAGWKPVVVSLSQWVFLSILVFGLCSLFHF